MRQRRVTGIEERLEPYAGLILRGDGSDIAPDGRAVRWYQRSSPRYILPEGFKRVYAEIGCGRGLFINTLAAGDPEGLYIGIEGCKTIVIRAIQKTSAAGYKNVFYIDNFINDAESAFGERALDGIFLNFSDPWPKERHADRRLTAPAKAKKYLHVLKDEGFVSFKTDGEAFFKYSLETLTNAGFQIAGAACDIATAAHSNAELTGRATETPTEYELKFREFGRPIYHFVAIKG